MAKRNPFSDKLAVNEAVKSVIQQVNYGATLGIHFLTFDDGQWTLIDAFDKVALATSKFVIKVKSALSSYSGYIAIVVSSFKGPLFGKQTVLIADNSEGSLPKEKFVVCKHDGEYHLKMTSGKAQGSLVPLTTRYDNIIRSKFGNLPINTTMQFKSISKISNTYAELVLI